MNGLPTSASPRSQAMASHSPAATPCRLTVCSSGLPRTSTCSPRWRLCRRFQRPVRAAIAAYLAAGLDVELLVENDAFARLRVHDPSSSRDSKVELGIDWRQYPPTVLDIGPVLARDDAVGNKVCALYSRGQARDYIDVDAALRSQAYTQQALLELAEAHDPGFERPHFADALDAVRRLPLAEFTAYGLRPDEARRLVDRMVEWAEHLR